MARISAFDRLKGLPEVFTTRSLPGLLGTDRKAASVYLNRWRERGLVSSLGPQIGVHFNLLRNPKAGQERRMDVLAYFFPGAVVAGVSALHAEGWTTQFPRQTEIMVPARKSLPRVHGATLHSRPNRWFSMAKAHVARPGPVLMVSPAFALADCWQTGHWHPDPDDIEWDLVSEADLTAAFCLFETDVPDIWKSFLDQGSTEPESTLEGP
ncbi:MAG: hypothetical protein F4213_06520 [Boseongicola sp. SB0677_bin_26]|nr:hypothetical protein [Boseongicola sp. SB0665_bin_10]MYG25664.1 hypothetical protein [Boseongicola sp. SB0677_bin_26]